MEDTDTLETSFDLVARADAADAALGRCAPMWTK